MYVILVDNENFYFLFKSEVVFLFFKVVENCYLILWEIMIYCFKFDFSYIYL